MTNNPIANNGCENELDWTAFCYAAGELNSDEAAQFEARLADDQHAREALARAVEVTQTVAAAESQIGDVRLPRPATNWRTRLSWMAIGGLAASLLALVWSGAFGPFNLRSAWKSAGGYELAAAWTQTRAELSSAKAAGLWPSVFSGHGDTDDDVVVNEALLDATAMDETPSWMDAAVLGLSGESSDESE